VITCRAAHTPLTGRSVLTPAAHGPTPPSDITRTNHDTRLRERTLLAHARARIATHPSLSRLVANQSSTGPLPIRDPAQHTAPEWQCHGLPIPTRASSLLCPPPLAVGVRAPAECPPHRPYPALAGARRRISNAASPRRPLTPASHAVAHAAIASSEDSSSSLSFHLPFSLISSIRASHASSFGMARFTTVLPT